MKELPTIKNAFLLVEDGLIADFGKMEDCPTIITAEIIDATGKMILPSWCDSHTHIVYAGNREGEFVDRINGLSYEEIANKGGGILNSAKKLQETSEDETSMKQEVPLGGGTTYISVSMQDAMRYSYVFDKWCGPETSQVLFHTKSYP